MTRKLKSARPRMEALEPRLVLSTVAPIPKASTQAPAIVQMPIKRGVPRFFRDADGTLVGVLLRGPGSGSFTLTNGRRSGAAIDALTLTGTNEHSRLIVSAMGGRSPGSSIQSLHINAAAGATAALGAFEGRRIDLATDGKIKANASVGSIDIQSIGGQATVAIAGSLSHLTTNTTGSNFHVVLDGNLGSLRAASMGAGAYISAQGITDIQVDGPLGRRSQILAGSGGIARLSIDRLDTSQIVANGPIGRVIVKHDMTASSIASKVDPGFDGEFGTDDDVLIHGAPLGEIGEVTIGGSLTGSSSASRTFGIVTFGAIGSVSVAGQVITVNGRGRSADRRVNIIPGPPIGVDPPVGPEYAISDFMGWGTDAPQFSNNVSYASSGQWQSLNVINYTPSHYARTNSSGVLVDNNTNQPLVDTSFQASIGTDFPTASSRYLEMSYLLGNPEILMENDFRQLQAEGFDGVRLYEVSPKDYVAAIEIAHRMSTEPGSKGKFYVYYEVATPDLSVAPYRGMNGTSVETRIQNLYNTITRIDDPVGSLETLHYVINTVSPAVFAATVPLVFFGHENLVSPVTLPKNTVLTDDNTSTPLLRWGINAVRQVLKAELGSQPKPAVTNALLAGLAIQVSTYVHPEVSTLIDVIQVDANSPIAYDNYPFQWGNNYFNTDSPYRNDNDPEIIPNAYPVDPGTGEIKYYDKTMSGGTEWTSGPPPVAPMFTPTQTVSKADLFWSLQWVSDRVNWIWGHLRNKPGDKTAQLIAETGWATDEKYAPPNDDHTPGKAIEGDLAKAQEYYEAVKALDFHIGDTPVMYFDAYDEPVKNSDPLMLSENHYGIFRWTGTPKWGTTSAPLPLTDAKGFTILSMNPSNYSDLGVISTPMRFADQKATDAAYSYSINGGPSVEVPWYYGVNLNSDQGSTTPLFYPNAEVLLRDGDVITITSPEPGDLQAFIKLKYDAAANSVFFVDPKPPWNPTLAPPVPSPGGSDWKINFTFPWLHGGSNDYANTKKFPRVFADFWAKPRS